MARKPTNVVLGCKPEDNPTPLIELMKSVVDAPATIHLVSLLRVGTESDEPQRLQALEKRLAGQAAALEQDGYKPEATARIIALAAGAELVQIAERVGADLIVIGLAKRSRVGKALLSSDAQRVLLSAPCPVLSSRLQ